MTDWKKEADAIANVNGYHLPEKLAGQIEALCRKAWNEAIEKAASLTESSFVEHEGYPFRLEDKLCALKHKEPEK